MASLDIKSLYPKVPVKKALECVREALEADTTLKDRTDWAIDDIMKLLKICIEIHFKTVDGYIYTQTIGLRTHIFSMELVNSNLIFGKE